MSDSNSNTYSVTLSDTWKFRFAFFEQNGIPGFLSNSPQFKEAFKALSFMDRIKVAMNYFAFFFGPIYLLILGLWKKALVLFALSIAASVILALFHMPAAGIAISMYYSVRANGYYYQKIVEGKDDWSI
ncbi:MAG: hypothetical protein GAK43_02213 [Stenotrophomonas maltophilia]|nr:MAG: hypothetical protein GAK43_02213 [Stenotrophomonas maltophilia]